MRIPTAIVLAVLAAARPARAEGPLEGRLDIGARYEHSGADELENSGVAESRLFLARGERHAYAAGFEGDVGLAEAGVRYRADVYPVGYRFGGLLGTLSLLAGGGARGVTGTLDAAWRARLRGEAALDLVALRVALEVAAAENLAGGERPDSTVDELSVELRAHYRSVTQVENVTAASGPFVAFRYERTLGSNFWGLVLGYGTAARNFSRLPR